MTSTRSMRRGATLSSFLIFLVYDSCAFYLLFFGSIATTYTQATEAAALVNNNNNNVIEDITITNTSSNAVQQQQSSSPPPPPQSRPPFSVIIDCDPAGLIATGLDVDDDLALIVALNMHRLEQINILGITVTAGNSQVEFSYQDALEVVYRLVGELDIPIHMGTAFWPILLLLPPSRQPYDYYDYRQPTNASRFLVETIMKDNDDNNNNNNNDNGITILALGPLGNIAAAYRQEPKIANHIDKLVIMGGVIHSHDHRLDYNFRFDPTSASIALSMPCPKLLLPVETAIQAAFGPIHLERVISECQEGQQQQKQQSSTGMPPVICSFLSRLVLQRRIMPWLVNWRYQDLIPHSKYYDSGFILWDVVALFAWTNPELFTEWAYFDTEFITTTTTTTMTSDGVMTNIDDSTVGPQAQFVMKSSEVQQTIQQQHKQHQQVQGRETRVSDRNRVLVPLTLESEESMSTLMFEHLLSLKCRPNFEDDPPMLTMTSRLGLIPYLAFLALAAAILLFAIVHCWIVVKRQRLSPLSSNNETTGVPLSRWSSGCSDGYSPQNSMLSKKDS